MRTGATIAMLTMLFGVGIGYWLGTRGEKAVSECSDDTLPEDTSDILADEENLVGARRAALASNENRGTGTGRAVSEMPSNRSRSSASSSDWQPKPEHRKTMARQRYGALFTEMELSESQVEALLDVLATQSERAGSASEGRMGRRWQLDLGNSTPEERERNHEEIAAVIGEQKAAQFDSLRKAMPARMTASTIREQLERVGQPLTDQQNQALITKAREFGASTLPSKVEGESPEETSERGRRIMREQRQDFRAEAASILTPIQLKRLDEIEAMRQDMRSRSPARRTTNQVTGGTGSTLR